MIPALSAKTIREILRDHYRSQFYDSEQTCGHGRKVRYWRPGDWYHQDDGSLCMDGPEHLDKLGSSV
jgi:hypothetical protein